MTGLALCDRLRVYVIIDPDQTRRDAVELVRQIVKGGATALQLRAKSGTDRERLALATQLASITQPSGVLFIMNDRVDLALASGADGVHLGVDDLSIEAAREIAWHSFVIGYSPESDEQATTARARGANYLGVGPVYGTRSKGDAGPAIGIETIRRRTVMSHLPVAGIGGIAPGNAAAVIESGGCGVCVMSAVTSADEPADICRSLRAEVDAARAKLQAGR
jgi:thiamine-phosphate pyrophosphorylase